MKLGLRAAVCGLLAAACAWSQAQEPRSGEPPARRWTTLERLSSERLAAAHAGDSAHTGGRPEELLRDARRIGVDIVFLSDHYRPPRDFMDSWRGLHDGVLFIPGSEAHGFLIHPEESVVDFMGADAGTLLRQVNCGAGMAFLSHVEERLDHPMDGLTGMEVYLHHRPQQKREARSTRGN